MCTRVYPDAKARIREEARGETGGNLSAMLRILLSEALAERARRRRAAR
jgi:hypothetical protein